MKTPLLFDFKRRGEAGRFRGGYSALRPIAFDRTGGQHGSHGNPFQLSVARSAAARTRSRLSRLCRYGSPAPAPRETLRTAPRRTGRTLTGQAATLAATTAESRIFDRNPAKHALISPKQTDPDGRQWTDGDLSAKGLSGGGYDYEYKGIRSLWRCPVETMKRWDDEGRLHFTRAAGIRLKRYLDELPGLACQSLWDDISPINSQAKERLAKSR